MTLMAKILLYNLSLVPLYVLFIVKKIDISGIEKIVQNYLNWEFYKTILLNNVVVLALIIFILFSIYAFKKLTGELDSGYGLPEKFEEIKNIDFNHSTFIATYILPLLAFTLNTTRDMIFMLVLLIFIGIIYIKTNLYYLSPVFIIFDIQIYSAINENGEEKILMSKEEKMKKIENLYYTEVGSIYFVRRSTK